jgi:hypothetical protein
MADERDVQRDYAVFLASELSKLDAELARRAMNDAENFLEVGGARGGFDWGDISGIVGYFRALVGPFETKMGVNKFWGNFRKLTLQYYLSKRDSIIRSRADIPLMEWGLKAYKIPRAYVSIGVPEGGSIQWADAVFTLHTKGVTVTWGDNNLEIPLAYTVAVGREIYLRLSLDNPPSVKAIDYGGRGAMSTLLVGGSPEAVTDLMKHIWFILKELRRLGDLEAEVLRLLGDMRSLEFIYSKVNANHEAINAALKRLRDLRYIDEFNVITADGLNQIRKGK